MLCWWLLGLMALLQGTDYAGRWRRAHRRGSHRGRDTGAMRSWPGDRPERRDPDD